MKIEEKNIATAINALLSNIHNLQMPVMNNSPSSENNDFKTVLSGVEQKHTKSLLSGMVSHYFSEEETMPVMDLKELSEEDVNFFKVFSENKNLVINEINPKENQVSFNTVDNNAQQVSYKSVNLSKGLFNLIEYSFNTNKPVRLDIQDQSSVILKVNTEGKLSAEFITGNPAIEYALKSSIPSLRQKLDSEGIPYDNISYRETKKDPNNNNKRNKGGYR